MKPRTRLIAGSHEAALLDALIPAAGRWIDCDALEMRLSLSPSVHPHRLAGRLIRWGLVQSDVTRGGTRRLMLRVGAVQAAQDMLDDAMPVSSGPRVCLPAWAPRWMVGGVV